MEKVQVFICAKVTIKADTGDRETHAAQLWRKTHVHLDCWYS